MQASAQLKTTAPGDGVVEAEPPQNVEGQQYVENKSYVTLEITLARPMVSHLRLYYHVTSMWCFFSIIKVENEWGMMNLSTEAQVFYSYHLSYLWIRSFVMYISIWITHANYFPLLFALYLGFLV